MSKQLPGARPVPLAVPAHVALELVDGIEAARARPGSRRGTAPSTCRPSTRPRAARTARRRPCRAPARSVPGRHELDGRADRVADGQPEQRSSEAIHHARLRYARVDTLIDVLLEARRLLARSDNDFSWSSFVDQDAALRGDRRAHRAAAPGQHETADAPVPADRADPGGQPEQRLGRRVRRARGPLRRRVRGPAR